MKHSFFLIQPLGLDEHGHSHTLFINRREYIQGRWDERRMQRTRQALEQVLATHGTPSPSPRHRL